MNHNRKTRMHTKRVRKNKKWDALTTKFVLAILSRAPSDYTMRGTVCHRPPSGQTQFPSRRHGAGSSRDSVREIGGHQISFIRFLELVQSERGLRRRSARAQHREHRHLFL